MTNNLLIYNAFIPSVRLCAYEQLNYLSKIGRIDFQHCISSKITKDNIKNSDVVFFVRSDSYFEECLARLFKRMNKYLVYVLDDDLLNVPHGLASSKHYNLKGTKKRIKIIMSLCDCLLSPSKKILEKYGEAFKKTGLIEEPALIYKQGLKENNEVIRIGFAGSSDRGSDIDLLLSDVISEILLRYNGKIKVEFFGAKPELVDKLNLDYYPYENNYEDYQKKMSELNWDIGIAPMPDTEFHRYKHYNKYIEYAANDIVGIYSNVYPYTEIIKDGENGFLCNMNKEEWIEKITYCIDNYDKLVGVKKKIKEEAEARFSVTQTSEIFIKAVPQVLEYKSARNFNIISLLSLPILRILNFLYRINNYIIANGVKTPVALYNKVIKKSKFLLKK